MHEHRKRVGGSSARVCFAYNRPNDDATALSSLTWCHIEDVLYWAGLTDWAHSVQGCWPYVHSVLDTPLRTRECICSRTDCWYIFHNWGRTSSRWHSPTALCGTHEQNNPFTKHVIVLPGLQLREHCCNDNFGLSQLLLWLVGVSIQQ